MRAFLLFAFCILAVPAMALDKRANPEPLCIACVQCRCNANCLCPGTPEHYRLTTGDFWAVVYVPTPAKPETLGEMIAGTIRWAVPHRKPVPVWIALPVQRKD